MALDRDEILVDNFQESLRLYQRSLVWAMTAAAAFFVITLTIGESEPVPLPWGGLSRPLAWGVALGMFIVLGVLAGSAVGNAETILGKLNVDADVVDAIKLYPSLATNANVFVRIGTVLVSPMMVLSAFGLQLSREWADSQRDLWWWGGLLLFAVLILAPYVNLAALVYHPLGTRGNGVRQTEQHATLEEQS